MLFNNNSLALFFPVLAVLDLKDGVGDLPDRIIFVIISALLVKDSVILALPMSAIMLLTKLFLTILPAVSGVCSKQAKFT